MKRLITLCLIILITISTYATVSNPSGSTTAASTDLVNRNYDNVVVVSTTITAALAGISDASARNTYLIYVPDGTYSEEFTAKDYVDIVGESRAGVIVQSSSGTTDTITTGGIMCMIANLTVTHTFNTGDSGVCQYPIHIDTDTSGQTPTDPDNSTTVLYKLNIYSYGTGAKAGLGIGLWENQNLYIVDCVCSSAESAGVFCHNQESSGAPCNLYMEDVTGSGGTHGFLYHNIGSGQQDKIYATDCVFFDGGTYDVEIKNTGSGAGESYLFKDSVSYSTSSFVDSTKVMDFELPMLRPVEQTANRMIDPGFDNLSIGYDDTPPASGGLIISGDVGIGTADPSTVLEVVDIAAAGTVTTHFQNNTTSNNSNNVDLAFSTWSGTTYSTPSARIRVDTKNAGVGAAAMVFYTRDDTATLDRRLYLSQNGRLGVADYAPDCRFSVVGSMQLGVTTVNAATYTVLDEDYTLHVTYNGAVAITIPTALNDEGRRLILNDGRFSASTQNITIDCEDAAHKIENSTDGVIINTDGDGVSLYCVGTDWYSED